MAEESIEYDKNDLEAVAKLRWLIEERGHTFSEKAGIIHQRPDADVAVAWDGPVVTDLYVNANFSNLEEVYPTLEHLRRVQVGEKAINLCWLGRLRGITEFTHLFYQSHGTQWPEVWASSSSLCAVTIIFDLNRRSPVLPDSMRQLKEISQMVIYYAFPKFVIPEWVGELPKLHTLTFVNCHIKSIPYFLVQTRLPFYVGKRYSLGKSGYINLTGVTLEEGDISLFSQPREIIEAYYRNKYGQQENERECKVIFLGEGNAGKSSLIDRIEHPEIPFVQGLPATPGVRVTKWNPQAPDGPLFLRVMDFGGQEIMHSMHRCFLTGHTVYVIVCESRADGNVDAEAVKWVETVNAFAPGCPVILALNKADINPHVSVNEKDLRQRNPALKLVLNTSTAVEPDSEYGVNRLADAILKEVPGCMDRFMANADWLGVKRELEDMVEGDKDYFTADQYREICRRHNIGDEDDALRFKMLDHFKNLGVSYYYDPHGLDHSLESIRVLNPAWLTNGIYRLILWTPEGGFLKQSEIRKLLGQKHEKDILKDKRYQGEEVDFILHVMEMKGFEISLNIGNEIEMIPMKLPKTPPDSADDYPYSDSIHLRWEASYLPDNLVHRLMIQMFPDLYRAGDGKYCVWRTGARFRRDGCDALAKMNEKGLDVYVYGERGDAARAFMEEFRSRTAAILTELNIKAAEIICHTVEGMELKAPLKSVLLQFSLRPEQDIFITGAESETGAYVSPKELLKSVYPDWEAMVEKFQNSRERGLDLKIKELELEQKRLELTRTNMDNQQKQIEVNHYEKKSDLEEEKSGEELEKMRAEVQQAREETERLREEKKKIEEETSKSRIRTYLLAGFLLIVALLVAFGILKPQEVLDYLKGFLP